MSRARSLRSVVKKTNSSGDTLYFYRTEIAADQAARRLRNIGFRARARKKLVIVNRMEA